jgi:hypothetical protein
MPLLVGSLFVEERNGDPLAALGARVDSAVEPDRCSGCRLRRFKPCPRIYFFGLDGLRSARLDVARVAGIGAPRVVAAAALP